MGKLQKYNDAVAVEEALDKGKAAHEALGGHTVKSDVPEGAKFTDTVYDDTAVKADILVNTEAINQNKTDILSVNKKVEDLKAQGVQQTPLFAENVEWLEENGDTSKVYVLPDGYIYTYMTIETEGGIEEVIKQITTGFTDDVRLSTSTAGSTSALSGFVTSPAIDISDYLDGFTIKLSGVKWCADGTTSTTGYAFQFTAVDGGTSRCGYLRNEVATNFGYEIVCDASTKEVTITTTSKFKELYKQICFSGKGASADAVVEIIYNKTTEGGTEEKWMNTGHAFVPADYEDRIIELEETVERQATTIAEQKEQIEALTPHGSIPDYVLTEAEEVADKVLSVRNADSLVVALASDLHTNGSDTSSIGVLHAGQGMDAINSLTQIDLVALLGDYEIYYFNHGEDNAGADNEDARKSFKHAKKAFSSVAKGVPFMMLQGNHDQFVNDTTEEAQQKYYAYIGANNVGTVTDYDNKFRNYGYRDFENYKIRVIYLNTADVSENEVTTDYKVSAEQLEWLNTVALNLADTDWGIIVLTHHPLNWYGMSNLLDALDTYKGKGECAELIAHFHGHLHNFRAETLGTNSIPTITIPNACFGRNNEYGTTSSYSDEIKATYGDIDESGNQRVFAKTAGTAEDTAFNVVVLDRQNRKIHCFNYGAGVDREISY